MENLDETEAKFLTEKDVENIINSVSDELLYDSLREQIEGVFSEGDNSTVFYVTYFTSKYDFLMNKYADYEELLEKIKRAKNEFFGILLEMLQEKFDFELDLPITLDKEQQYSIITSLYSYLVINNDSNAVTIIENYIKKEFKDLSRYYKTVIDKKDLTYINLKKNLNKDMTAIICKLPEIIYNIQIEDGEDLVNLSLEDKEEYLSLVVNELIEKNWIYFGDDFVNNILSNIKKRESYYLLARTRLFETYKEINNEENS